MTLTLLVLFLLAARAPAQVGWAEKMLEKTSHDWGTVPRGGKLVQQIKVTNIYAVRLEIVSLTSGCGCVTASAPKRVLEPRESTYIEVTMDTTRVQGPKAVVVKFTVGPEFISSAEIRVSANVRGDIVFNPGQFNFGTVPQGQTPSMSLDVEYAGPMQWQVQEISIRKDFPFTVASRELYRQPGRIGYQLQLTLKQDAPPGPIKENLYLRTNDPASPTVPILVEANVLPTLTVAPGTLTLGAVKVSQPLVRRVVVRGNRPFVIAGVAGDPDVSTNGELRTSPSPVQTLAVSIKVDQPGEFRKVVQIKTDGGETVPLTIEGSAGP
jgi:hypothetical protein